MREIKFRVWTGMRMEYDVVVGKFGAFYVNSEEKGDGMNANDSASLTQNTTMYHQSNPLMQFTGLKDKNGKEIYEGDIILNNDIHFEVIWKEAGFFLRGGGHDWIFLNEERHSELVGNIYENKELLK